MTPNMYRVTSARSDEIQSEVPGFEFVRSAEQTDAAQAAHFVCAITLDQLRRAAAAVRMVAAGPQGSSGIDIQIVSDSPALPIIDGVPQYQGPPDVNPDWRVAARFDLGDTSTTFFGALDYLESQAATEA